MAEIFRIPFANAGAPNLVISEGQSVGVFGENNSGKTEFLQGIATLKKGVKYRELPRMSSSDKALFNNEISAFFGELLWAEKGIVYDVVSRLSTKLLIGMGDTEDAFEFTKAELNKNVKDAGDDTLAKIGLLQALSGGASLVIIDDVFGIRPSFKKKLAAFLKRVTKENGTHYLIASTDLAFLSATCARITVINEGCLIEENTTKSILSSPCHPYTKWLVSAHNMKKEIGTTFIRTEKDSKVKKGCMFAQICPYAMEVCHQSVPKFITVGAGTICCHKIK